MRDRSLRSGERQVAEDLNGIEPWHRWRYEQAFPFIKDKTVLDLGCGVGYGTFMMAQHARSCAGIDDSQEAIFFAEKHFLAPNVSFSPGDISQNRPSGPFDVVTAFEVIEHIPDPEDIFQLFARINPALILASVPHLKCPMGGNQFHYRHFGMDELIESFWKIGFRPLRAELVYFGKGLCNFLVVQRVTP